MTKEEMVDALKNELETFKKSMPQYATPEDLQKKFEMLEDQLKEANMKDELEGLKTALKTQGEQMEKLRSSRSEKLTMREQVEKSLKDNADQIKAVATGSQRSMSFAMKADVYRSSVVNSTQAFRLPDVGQLAMGQPIIASLFREATVGPDSNGIVRYIDQSASGIIRSAATVAEGGIKPESAAGWEEFTLPLQKIADSIPVSKEALNDVSFIQSELNRLLEVNITMEEDFQFYSGDGVAPNITGIWNYAQTWVAPQAGLQTPNIYDLIVKVQETIASQYGSKFVPNVALMSHADVNRMRLSKDANDNYILPPFAGADGSTVAGIRIVASNQVASNTMIVGDFNQGTRYMLESFNISIGYVDDQFIRNMVTILAEKREALLVRSVDINAFQKVTDIDAALTTLGTTPP